MAEYKTNTIGAANSFSTPFEMRHGGILTLTGTWTATVSVQRQLPDKSAWVDVTNNSGTAFTATANGTYSVGPFETPALYRWGIKTGNYTSGSVVGYLGGI
jgi:hypothetical protein